MAYISSTMTRQKEGSQHGHIDMKTSRLSPSSNKTKPPNSFEFSNVISNHPRDMTGTTKETSVQCCPRSRHRLTSDMISFTATIIETSTCSSTTPNTLPTFVYTNSNTTNATTTNATTTNATNATNNTVWTFLKSNDNAKRDKKRRKRRFRLFSKQLKQEEEEEKDEKDEKKKKEARDQTIKMMPMFHHSSPPIQPFGQLQIESTVERTSCPCDTSTMANGYMYSSDRIDRNDASLSSSDQDRRDKRWCSSTSRGSWGRAWSRALSVTQDRENQTTIPAFVTATPTSVWNTFLQTVSNFADKVAITGREQVADRTRRRRSLYTAPMVDVAYSWAQHAVRVRCVARMLLQLGFCAGEGVVISAQNSPLLQAVNLAVVSLGGVVAHVRSTWSASELREHIFPTADATLVVVDSLEDNFRQALEALDDQPETLRPTFRAVVILGDLAAVDCAVANLPANIIVVGAEDLLATNTFTTGDAAMTPSLNSLAPCVLPGQCCLLAFDYDGLGRIRGAELSHDNVIYTAAALVRSFGLLSRDRLVGYLPLHHVASQVIEFYMPLAAGLQVVCAPTYDLPLVRVIAEHKPTVFFATPATWTRFSQQVYRAKGDANAAIYRWAKTRATNNSQKLLFAKGKGAKSRSLGYMLAKALVLNNIKKKIGLESCTACYSVLAPLDFELERLFKTVDTPIYQLFGTAETSGFAAINFPHAWELGSCGRALPGTTIRCDERSQETVLRGRNVFQGYRYSRCSGTKSSNNSLSSNYYSDDTSDQYTPTCDSDGWLCLWQRGFLTPTGFLKLSDPRDFLVLATGDWVPIQPFERAMMELMPELDRAVLIGDGRTFVSVLLFLKTSGAGCRSAATNKQINGIPLDDVALEVGYLIGSSATTVTEAIRCQQWAVHFDTILEKLPQVCSISGYRVCKWILMATDFSIESGELDPDTGDICRRTVDQKYQALLDSLYS